MRFIAYADIHFAHNWPEFNPVEANGKSRWLNITVDVWNQIQDYAIHYDVAAKLFAGDLSHKRSFIHTTVNNSILDLYKNSTVKEIMVPGNHDRLDQKFNAVQALDGIGKACLADRENGCWGIVGIEPGEKIPKPHSWHSKYLLAHGQLQGATNPNGFEITGGYTLKDFEGWDLVVLGDIHKKQIHGNVLIPGAPMQQNWGDTGLECGCWLIDTEEPNSSILPWAKVGDCWAQFLPIKAPRFIVVTQENIEAVLKVEKDDYNYYDFRLTSELDKASYKELKQRFPNSYLIVKKPEKKEAKVFISARTNSPKEILEKYYAIRVKGESMEQFVEKGLQYLFTADPKQINRSHKDVTIRYLKAENFLCFEKIFLDFEALPHSLYQITGSSDDQTSTVNGIGKSALAIELLSWVLYDKLCRSSTRSKDRIIHDPTHSGHAKNLLGEVGIRVGKIDYIIQRYRKHASLGSGNRILRCQSN